MHKPVGLNVNVTSAWSIRLIQNWCTAGTQFTLINSLRALLKVLLSKFMLLTILLKLLIKTYLQEFEMFMSLCLFHFFRKLNSYNFQWCQLPHWGTCLIKRIKIIYCRACICACSWQFKLHIVSNTYWCLLITYI